MEENPTKANKNSSVETNVKELFVIINELRDEIKTLRSEFSDQMEKKESTKLNSLKETFIAWSTRADINCYTKIFEYENVFVIV